MRFTPTIATFLTAALSLSATFPANSRADEQELSPGQRIYSNSCAGCHGENGTGTDIYEKPLAGDLSVPQLAKLIQKTMPEDDPGTLSSNESQQVAQYVYDAFYSAIARQRNQPARIELARLTVRQYRLSVADLIGSFRDKPVWNEERGLKAEYYESRRPGDRRRRKESRIDWQVNFDFGMKPPIKKIGNSHEFSIRWEGSVLAPETGEYELVVRTEHAARLWLNDDDDPLIDAWVKSGKDTEFTADLFLVGGKVYPLKLDFSKATQGVNKKDKKEPPPTPASISLLWKRPHGEVEPIPNRNLAPHRQPEVFLCDTPFPPDDRSYGWERGTAISKAWERATTDAAIQTGRYVTKHLDRLTSTRPGDKNRTERVKAFCRTFADRAFRRPITDDMAAWLIDKQFAEAPSVENAVKRVVLLTLKSPRFLYREVGGPDQYDVASRLSFGLWDSIPDETLLNAAREGQLKTEEQVAAQAERMLSDLRAKTKIRNFLLTWLHANTEMDIEKDAKKYPGYDQSIASDLRTSLELFLDEVAWSEKSDYRELLLSEEVYLNDRLAKFYEVKDKRAGEKDFTPVKLDHGKRAGILTHPYLMSLNAHESETSPIHRGVFIVRGVLGHALKPPPEAVTPLPADLHPSLTTRERVILQTDSATCMTCHSMINPLGFSLEKFDSVGRFREKDHNKPIDDAGSYHTRTGQEKSFEGARQLAEFLAQSPETHAAFAEQFFHHLVQQSINAYGSETQEKLTKEFTAHNFHIRKLAVTIMKESALTGRKTEIAKNAQASK